VADVFIAQMQDLLEKPADCRTNTPGTAEGNWRWRMKPGECTPALAAELLEMTKMYGRL
jgi:4-alpha-glucanotransferase